MVLVVLVPRHVADVLDNPDDGRRDFMLHAEAEHGHCRGAVVDGERRQPAGEERRRSDLAGCCARMRIGHVDIRCTGIVDKRGVGGSVVDVVALNALEEGSESAAENGLAVAEEIFRESNARLKGVVVVLDEPSRESALSSQSHAVHVVRAR